MQAQSGQDRPHRECGFTLVELITVMSIVGILLAIGVPSYRYVTNANRLSAEVNGLLGDLQYARAEAIREGSVVTVCASTDGATCVTTGSSWNTGWLVFSDTNNNAQVDAGEPILRVQAAFSNGDTFQANPAVRAVKFNREGLAMGLPGTVLLSLHDKTANSVWTRCLSVTVVGALTTLLNGQQGCT